MDEKIDYFTLKSTVKDENTSAVTHKELEQIDQDIYFHSTKFRKRQRDRKGDSPFKRESEEKSSDIAL